MKTTWRMGFSEDVGNLISRGNKDETNVTLSEMMSHKVTIELNMFCAFVEDIITSNLNSTLIVTVNSSCSGVSNSNVLN